MRPIAVLTPGSARTFVSSSGVTASSTDSIIASLRTPNNYTPNASIDYANELQARRSSGTEIPAYAKIAARDWCFFVTKTTLLVGRADAAARPNPPESSLSVSEEANGGRHQVSGPEARMA